MRWAHTNRANKLAPCPTEIKNEREVLVPQITTNALEVNRVILLANVHGGKTVYIKAMYIYLTTHFTYSLQEGLMTPAELVQAAQANGMPALGLTDHNLLTGAIEFVTVCKTANLQPIVRAANY
jgi:hypothetical protein